MNHLDEIQATPQERAATYGVRSEIEVPLATRVLLSSGAIIRAGIHCWNVADDSPIQRDEFTQADVDQAWFAVNGNCQKHDEERDQRQAREILARREAVAS